MAEGAGDYQALLCHNLAAMSESSWSHIMCESNVLLHIHHFVPFVEIYLEEP
jgi:hypothetical protein